jgi:hypothetical protein
MLHLLRNLAPADPRIDERYLAAVARRMFRLDASPALETLSAEQLRAVLAQVSRFLRRRAERGEAETVQPD